MPRHDRVLVIAQAFRQGLGLEKVRDACKYDPWFLEEIRRLVAVEAAIGADGLPDDAPGLLALKKLGFSDERLGELAGMDAGDVTARRHGLDVRPVYKRVDTCAGEFASRTPYMYSAYEGDGLGPAECEADPSARTKVVILGGGPNRIGQGIEFDYLLRPCRLCAEGGRLRDHHGQLQPRNRVDRLRHLGPPLISIP